MRTGFGKTRSTGEIGIYKMAFRTRDEQVGRAALDAGRDLLMAAIDDTPFDLAAAVARAEGTGRRATASARRTAHIVEAATERRIPSIRLTDGNLVQLGHGAAQRRIWTAETDRTSAIAEGIASDKDLTKSLLQVVRRAGAGRRAGAQRRRSMGRSAGHRPAGGGQAVRRQPRPRRVAQPDDPGRRRSGLRTRRAQGRQQERASSSASSPATSTACWWSASSWWPPPRASRCG